MWTLTALILLLEAQSTGITAFASCQGRWLLALSLTMLCCWRWLVIASWGHQCKESCPHIWLGRLQSSVNYTAIWRPLPSIHSIWDWCPVNSCYWVHGYLSWRHSKTNLTVLSKCWFTPSDWLFNHNSDVPSKVFFINVMSASIYILYLVSMCISL